MSAKQSKRLRRLAVATTQKELDEPTYREVPVHANKNRRNHMSKQIVLDKKSARAFYQKSKEIYKSGEGKKMADKLDREYREEQKRVAAEYAKKIEAEIQQKNSLQYAEPIVIPEVIPTLSEEQTAERVRQFIEGFRDWLIYEDKDEEIQIAKNATIGNFNYIYQVHTTLRADLLLYLAVNIDFAVVGLVKFPGVADELDRALPLVETDRNSTYDQLYQLIVEMVGVTE